ncbi:hypothetical protein IT396_01625 [Candidatus Nomurabacteria bacterium]|nr:hypothetical protein [Candidatus Nomurabacteria bacterium]
MKASKTKAALVFDYKNEYNCARTAQEERMKQREDILALAAALKNAVIEVPSGDRAPAATISSRGRRWIIAGLKLLANGKDARAKKKKK